MRTSIRSRLVFSYVLTTVLSVAVMGGLGLSLVAQLGQLRERQQLGLSAQAIAEQVEPLLAGQPAPMLIDELAQGAAFLLDARVRILGSEATVLADAVAMDDEAQIVWFQESATVDALAHSVVIRSEELVEAQLVPPIESEHEVILDHAEAVASAALDEAMPLSFSLRRSPSGFGTGMMRLEILPDAHSLAPGVASKVVIGAAQAEHFLEPSLGSTDALNIEEADAPARAFSAGDHHLVVAGNIKGHLAQFLAGDLSHPQPERSPRVVSVAIGPADAPSGYVEISQAPDVSGANLGSTARAFGLAALGASLLSAMVGLAMSRGLSAPLAELDAAAGRMGAGDLAARAPVGRPDEIGRLAQGFNSMADGLEASFGEIEAERDALRRFVADASHELRTPITALGNYNTLLQSTESSDIDARTDFLAEQGRQIERLTWITRNLLDLSRLDAGLVELELETETAGSLIDAALASLGPKAEVRRQDINLEPEGLELSLICDPGRVAIALGNLIDNAIKFSPAGTAITVRASKLVTSTEAGDEPGILIEVEDAGPGIEPGDAERVFERFHRGPRTASIAGSGLGLAIVRGIAQAHGGWVRSETAESGGACLCLWLPVDAASVD